MIYYLQLVLGGLIAGPGGASHRMVRPAGAPKTTKDLFAILGIPCTPFGRIGLSTLNPSENGTAHEFHGKQRPCEEDTTLHVASKRQSAAVVRHGS